MKIQKIKLLTGKNMPSIILAVLLSFAVVYNVGAVSFLSFMEPVTDVLRKIEKEKEKIEEKYNTYMQKLDARVSKAFGAEGSLLFKEVVLDKSNAVVISAARGQFNLSPFTEQSLLDSLTSQLGNMKLDYANVQNMMEDYIKAEENAKSQKDATMRKTLVALEAERSAFNDQLLTNDTPELRAKLDETDKNIALLKVQLKDNMETDVLKSTTVKNYQNKLTDMQNKIDLVSIKTFDTDLQKKLNKEVENLFDYKENSNEGDLELEEAYKINIDKLFLKENEKETSENIAKINKLRRTEYYNAHKELIYSVISTYGSIVEEEDRIKYCTEASQQAQGIFGASAMRICIDLQNARAAARYMQLLLAEMRFDAMSEMQKWTDKYKLTDYNKDVSKFNLDDYVMKASDFASGITEKANRAVSSLLGK